MFKNVWMLTTRDTEFKSILGIRLFRLRKSGVGALASSVKNIEGIDDTTSLVYKFEKELDAADNTRYVGKILMYSLCKYHTED
jgi:hypothetical protein